ncbi:hypothetical protein EUTSA_v10017866mg [Eutrema salsugineum]|uniref:Prolamin-like domain-containing protein n=2 Tax=Eutrema salsugineum TaxID=72664 RepID=V4LKZ7_EUTSA|nr:hypothetical protein EUTSA_v10017866mg [Eutrema salsugineum]
MLVLISAVIPRPSEAAPQIKYCSTERIDRVPGCFNALRLASDRDYRSLTVECCRAVYATLPDTCFLTVYPDRVLPISVFRVICTNTVPAGPTF